LHEPSYLSLYTTGLIPAAISAWFAGAADARGPWARPNDRWSLDFSADQSIDVRPCACWSWLTTARVISRKARCGPTSPSLQRRSRRVEHAAGSEAESRGGLGTVTDLLYQIPLIRTRGPIGAVRWTRLGRISKATTSSVGTPWMWTLAYGGHEDRTTTHGYEATRHAAMQASARSWHRET